MFKKDKNLNIIKNELEINFGNIVNACDAMGINSATLYLILDGSLSTLNIHRKVADTLNYEWPEYLKILQNVYDDETYAALVAKDERK